MTLDDYVDTFELFDDWNARYQYLTELGDHLEPLPEVDRTDINKVKGCMSQVWVHAYRNADDGLVYFHGDCDTATIKGVLALLIDLSSGKSVDEVLAINLDEIFERLNLHDHLSPNRHFGIYAIVELMKAQAQALDADSGHVAASA